MSYPYRCSKAACRKRVSLPRKVEDYVYTKKCPACKCESLKLDMAHRAESKRNRCGCDSKPWPHRKGSNPFCIHTTATPTDDDFQVFYSAA